MATLYEACNSPTPSLSVTITPTFWIGETFRSVAGHLTTSMKAYLKKSAGATGTIQFRIYRTSGGVPTGSPVATHDVDIATELSTTAGWVEAPLYFQLLPNVTYAFVPAVLARTGTINNYGVSGFPYSRGTWIDTSNAGASWNIAGTSDMGFEDWGEATRVTTGLATSRTTSGFTLNGTLGDVTGIDQIGFDVGTVSGTYTMEFVTSSGIATGAYSLPATGLNSGTGYYFRAKVHHTTYGWLYGVEYGYSTSLDASLTLFESYDAAGTTTHTFAGNTWRGESFTPSSGHQIKGAKVKLCNTSSVRTGTITISIRATSGGKPTGSDLVSCTLPIMAAVDGATPDWLDFSFGAGVALVGGTLYAIVVRSSATIGWRIRVGGTPDYAGKSQYSTDAGASWATPVNDDYMFKEYGEAGIETFAASSIKANSAQGNCSLPDNTDITHVGLDWGTVSGVYPNSIDDTTVPVPNGVFGMTMTGLTASTVYFYRAKVYHSAYGWLYGDEETFTTLPPYPLLDTDPPTEANSTHIDAVGNITSIGLENADERGFVYGLVSQADPGNVAPLSSGYSNVMPESGSFGTGSFTLVLTTNIQANKTFFIRAYAHNSYGYSYGEEVYVFTNSNINILFPTSDVVKNIRCDSGPGGHWPHRLAAGESRAPHYSLLRAVDCSAGPGTFGSIIGGKYIYERDDVNDNLYYDLFGMSNPFRRDDTVVKIKWKARLITNTYGFGEAYRKLYTHSTLYTGALLGLNAAGNYVYEVFYTNPNTGLAWTLADIDAVQAGIELGKGGGWGTPACDALWVHVLWANASVVTAGADNYLGTSARLHGTIVEDEGDDCIVHFEYGPTTGYGSVTANQTTKHKGDGFYADVTGITSGTHFRAVLHTAAGETFYGADMTIEAAITSTVVSKIRHVYRPGSYRMELGFGDVTDEVKTAVAQLNIKTETTKKDGTTEETTQTITAPAKVVDEMSTALVNEGIGAIVDRIKTDKAFLKYGFTTTDVMKWIEQGLSVQEILKKMRSYTGAKINLEKTEPALAKIGLTTGQTMDLLKQNKLQPKDIIAGTDPAVKRAKAFNKYGYSEAEVRAMIKKGMQPGDIVRYMMAHPK